MLGWIALLWRETLSARSTVVSLPFPHRSPILAMDADTLGKMSSSQKDELMRTVQAQVALANMQELLSKVTDKCFRKCISSPGTSLGSSDQKCIAMCMDRYMDSFNLVSKAYSERLRQESGR